MFQTCFICLSICKEYNLDHVKRDYLSQLSELKKTEITDVFITLTLHGPILDNEKI